MRMLKLLYTAFTLLALGACSDPLQGSIPAAHQTYAALAVDMDPLVRMPGTQPGSVTLDSPKNCTNCHGGYNKAVEPEHNWRGSMMAQAARDPLFWACMVVSGQDSVHAVGTPNAMDLCERCHFPEGWLENRSDPPNASLMTGSDYDGVSCDFCHKMFDPHYQTTYQGTREGNNWAGYWDESNASSTPSAAAATAARADDAAEAAKIKIFNGGSFFTSNLPFSAGYTEAASGQFFVVGSKGKRGPFSDAGAKHTMHYSRFHKSKYFCASCHDVSNPALANLSYKGTPPGNGTTILPTEQSAAHSYFHVERTFSEFMLSAYGKQGGAAGVGPFAPTAFTTSLANNYIARCQDCHMRDTVGVGGNKNSAINRPAGSTEHPKSGQPLHDLTGGNIFISYILASTVSGSSNYDATNAGLLVGKASTLTMDLSQGLGVDAAAMLDGVARAKQQLKLAASIKNLTYSSSSGALSFRIQNQTGHKLISGFPEGRRMFVNVKVYSGVSLVREINPYSSTASTLKGLPAAYSPSSPALGAAEVYRDDLVYETKPSSTITGEQQTFHFVLATGRYKDNRIPPKGFDISKAAARLSRPVVAGSPSTSLYSSAENAGGYDQVSLTVPAGATQVVVNLYYQVTSREYIEFLRDEINGTAGSTTLPSSAYIIQTDAFFSKLKAWGNTIWSLWNHNRTVPGAAPFLMTTASVIGTGGCAPPVTTLISATAGTEKVTLAWSNKHAADSSVVGYTIYYDQAGKSQKVADVGKVTTHVDTGLTGGQTFCYKVATRYAACAAAPSNIKCATPKMSQGDACTAASQCASGYCVDGFCCSSACGGGSTGDCQACSVTAGATTNGTCGAVTSGKTCRASAGTCDLAEACNGSSTVCPADVRRPSGYACRAAAGVCDKAEACNGTSVLCPSDGAKTSGTLCRASAGVCDPAEVCNGSSKTCPANAMMPSSYVCRVASGICDKAETCTGTTALCPSDGVKPSGTVCRYSAGICDVAETCGGSGKTCPANTFKPKTTTCRKSTGICDPAEACTGAAASCPANSYSPKTKVCRAKTGTCDLAESCSGGAAACPGNTFVKNFTSCTGGYCYFGLCIKGSADAGVPDLGQLDEGVDTVSWPDLGVDTGPEASVPDLGQDSAGDVGSDSNADAASDTSPLDGAAEASAVDASGEGATADAEGPDLGGDQSSDDGGGCGCRVAGGAPSMSTLLLLLGLGLRMRRRRR